MKKQRWFQIITLILCLVLLVIVIEQKKAIRTLNEDLRYHLAMEMAEENSKNSE